uniref:Putative secreted protein n=1 Tax=Anopheles darlingi TaxID=43151 RepID=A0A2M4DNP2_ANODA
MVRLSNLALFICSLCSPLSFVPFRRAIKCSVTSPQRTRSPRMVSQKNRTNRRNLMLTRKRNLRTWR